MRTTLLKCFGLSAILAVSLLFVPRALAQATTGSITGTVTDTTGAVIPHADVVATEVSKGITFRGRSNEVGEYIILNVTPG
ncbi:MAG TPA: carboxypeptidase-like regulatory domain-containing protein, partial [Acidobacteriaceae bacterium]|nr:carboxypeptidase-like regulatory domain-containing protein [Acidobacteriaceae bacterium]